VRGHAIEIRAMHTCLFHQIYPCHQHQTTTLTACTKKSTLYRDDVNSFRPISNLSFLSKLVERVAADRLKAHFDSKQSVWHAIIAVHDEITGTIDDGNVCALVLLDLSAAFDTVDHQTLIRVLSRHFGVADLALNCCLSL